MTTYSKETALFDTGAIATDINEAGQTADRYITYVDADTGIQVHNAEDDDNYVQLNSDGMEVFQDNASVAMFGSEARIGPLNDAEKVIVGNGGVSMYTANNAEYFKAFVDDVNLRTIQTAYGVNMQKSATNTGNISKTSYNSYSITDYLPLGDWDAVSSGDVFSITIELSASMAATEKRNGSYTFKLKKGTDRSPTCQLRFIATSVGNEFRVIGYVDYDSVNDKIKVAVQGTESNGGNHLWTIRCKVTEIIYPKLVPTPTIKIDGLLINSDLVGEIKQYAGATVPHGWHLCDGSELLKEDYPLLYEAIGDLWGTASDSDHFKIPDFSGRVPVGFNSADTIFDTVGKTGGNKNAIVPYHNHNLGSYKYGSNYCASGNRSGMGQHSSATTTVNTSYAGSSGNATNANLQPYAVVKYIICTA